METLIEAIKSKGLRLSELFILRDFIQNLIFDESIKESKRIAASKPKKKRLKVPKLSSEQLIAIESACAGCKYLPVVKYLCQSAKNKPTEINVFDKLLIDLGVTTHRQGSFQYDAVSCLNTTLRNRDLDFRLRRLGPGSTKFCFFEN